MSCGCLKPKCSSPNPVVFQCTDNDGRDVEFVDLGEFLPRVSLVAKGVPDDVALEYLRQSAQTLARDSLILKREVRLDVQAGVRDYYLDNGDNEQVHYVSHIQLGKGFCPYRYNERTSYRHFVEHRDFVFEPNDKIILTHPPKEDAEQHLRVRYFAMPSQTACQLDKLIFDRYHDVVVNGALSSLLLMRQYEFADPQMAMLYQRQFQQGIAKAKIDAMRGFETGVQHFHSGGRI